MIVVVFLVLAVLSVLLITGSVQKAESGSASVAKTLHADEQAARRSTDYEAITDSEYHAAALNELMEMQPTAAGGPPAQHAESANAPADLIPRLELAAFAYLVDEYRCRRVGGMFFCPRNEELFKKPGINCRGDGQRVVCRVLPSR